MVTSSLVRTPSKTSIGFPAYPAMLNAQTQVARLRLGGFLRGPRVCRAGGSGVRAVARAHAVSWVLAAPMTPAGAWQCQGSAQSG